MRRYAFVKAEVTNLPLKNAKALVRESNFTDFQFTPRPGFVYSRVRAISARVNRNFDGFRASELAAAYRTFIGRPAFVNHNNHDPKRGRGVILASSYIASPGDEHIQLLVETDAEQFPKLAKRLVDGDIDSVSMGTDVKISVCSYCYNEATVPQEFCDHVLRYKGHHLARVNSQTGQKESVLVYEDCRGLNFFEISYVFDPADETALTQEVMSVSARKTAAFSGYLLPTSKVAVLETISYGDIVAPAEVDTLREENICPECGDENFDGVRCNWCEYTTPPEELQDPDVDKAREVDIRQDQKEDDLDEDEDEQSEGDEDDDDEDENRREGKSVTTTAGLTTAMRKRRLAEAQRRLADMSEQDQGNSDNNEAINSTPEPGSTGITTDNVRGDVDDKTSVQDLDDNDPGDEILPDDRQDVTVLENEELNYDAPKTSRRRPSRTGRRPVQKRAADDDDGDGDADIAEGDEVTFDSGDGRDSGTVTDVDGDSITVETDDGDQTVDATDDNVTVTSRRRRVAKNRRKADVADDPAEAAAPDVRTDVEVPVGNDTSDYAQDSQFDVDEYENNQAKDKADPVTNNDQIWVPKNSKLRTASSVQMMELTDLYLGLGLVPQSDKYKLAAEIEKLPAVIAADRIKLLKLVKSAQVQTASRTARVVPRVGRQAPALGRQANVGVLDADTDALLLI